MSDSIIPQIDESLERVQSFHKEMGDVIIKVVKMTQAWISSASTQEPGYKVFIETAPGRFAAASKSIDVYHFRLYKESEEKTRRIFRKNKANRTLLVETYFYFDEDEGDFSIFTHSEYPSKVHIDNIIYLKAYIDHLSAKLDEMKTIMAGIY